jgi:hypothetical protein
MLPVGVHGQPGTSGAAGSATTHLGAFAQGRMSSSPEPADSLVRPPSAYAARTVAYEGATGSP